MIPFIRSLSELMRITESRDYMLEESNNNKINSSIIDSRQRKRYLKSIGEEKVNLPKLPIKTMRKWIKPKEALSRFFDDLDYNNQIQSSYDLTLIERQNHSTYRDAA